MTIKTEFGKINASKKTLNALSVALDLAAHGCDCKHYVGLKLEYEQVADEIFKALQESGYYERG